VHVISKYFGLNLPLPVFVFIRVRPALIFHSPVFSSFLVFELGVQHIILVLLVAIAHLFSFFVDLRTKPFWPRCLKPTHRCCSASLKSASLCLPRKIYFPFHFCCFRFLNVKLIVKLIAFHLLTDTTSLHRRVAISPWRFRFLISPLYFGVSSSVSQPHSSCLHWQGFGPAMFGASLDAEPEPEAAAQSSENSEEAAAEQPADGVATETTEQTEQVEQSAEHVEASEAAEQPAVAAEVSEPKTEVAETTSVAAQ
jgi:hypothetical protein